MDFELVVRKGQQPGRRFTITPGARLTIGRGLECDIQLPDKGVSRRHCGIESVGLELRVRDLDSANGTYINGRPVKVASLTPGGQLTLGQTTLECLAGGTPLPHSHEAATLAFSEDGSTTVVRKLIDTGSPDLSGDGKAGDVEVLQRAQRNLATAYKVSRVLASASSLDGVFDRVIEAIFQTIDADRLALLLRSKENGDQLEIVAARSRKAAHAKGEITVSRTVVRDVLEQGVSTLSSDASADARYREGESIIQQRIRSVMCVPIATDDRVLGVLYADSRSQAGAFTEKDLELLALLGNQAGIGIHRVQLKAELEDFFFDTIRAIVATIDAKDGYTHRHSERVAATAVRLARELGLGPEELELVKHAGLLHDVGKIGVPGDVLNKPGKLTPEEFDEIKKHPMHGVRILSHIKNPRVVAILPGVRHHHECWDGSGYPDGLAGHDIPFLGRVLCVADVFDALRSNRPYRQAMELDVALKIISDGAGIQFDPQIAAAAAALHKRGELD
ncbi:MAG: HD domain-containing phosphohydrolase [Gemmatimonadota bacterium]